MTDADAAMKKGDWAAYGEAQKRLEAAVKKALEAEEAQVRRPLRLPHR